MHLTSIFRRLSLVAAATAATWAVSALLAPQANAQACTTVPDNCAPPLGAFLDLAVPNSDGSGNTTAVPHGYTSYSANFTAGFASTNLTFAFREDPAFLHLANVTVTDLTNPAGNILLNGDFSLGPLGASAPTNWTYLNQYGAEAGGQVAGGCGPTGGNCYSDGAVQAYDAITQVLSTTVGDVYDLSFDLDDTGGLTTFSDLSTNGDDSDTGGNGIDLLAYQGLGTPVAAPVPGTVPEPATIALFGAGLIGLGWMRRRKA